MPAQFTRAEVQKVAALAHLELADDEVDLFARQLGDMLTYANQLEAIDTTGVPPTTSVMAGQESDREDRLVPSLDRRDALANAPDASLDGGLFKVPRVIG
jgi:aspartyl-tRNA(Asn)/glutamyl-tRNA(Gln) amidotransferase subunit C